MRITRHTEYWKALLSSLCLLLLASGCTVQYVSRYDEATERSITTIQRSVETMLQSVQHNLGTPDAAYEHYASTYEQLYVDADRIKGATVVLILTCQDFQM